MGPKACLWQRLPSLDLSTALASGELMILPRNAFGPLPSRVWIPKEHLERHLWGSLQGLTGESPRCPGWERPAHTEDWGTYPRGRRLLQHPPAGLVLQSLVARLVDACQGDAISSLLLLSPAESSIQVCGPLLGSRQRGREMGKFVCLRPHQFNTPARRLVACPAQYVTRSPAASVCFVS